MIKFSDVDWINVDGQIIKMSIENNFNTNARLTHNYLAPVITEDTWGGETYPVQINLWESYIMQIAVKELSVHMIAKIQSCSYIQITDTNTNETITADTKSTGAVSIEMVDRFQTTNQSFNFIVRTKKIKLYPGISRLSTNVLRVSISPTFYNFFTDQKIINFVNDSERINFDNSEGFITTAKSVAKKGYKMVFYLMESQAVSLKEKTENLGSTIVINPSGINKIGIERAKVVLSELSEGLFRCELELITSSAVAYA